MRTHNNHLLAVLIVFIFSCCNGLAAEPTLKDDAYHYMRNNIDDKLYNEWWYFNGVSNDTQFFFNYLLSDPDNITGQRRIQAIALVLEEGMPPVFGIHNSRGFGGDRSNPIVDIDRNGFSASNTSSYRIFGSARDILLNTPITWDLTYTAEARPWFPTPVQMHVGHIKGDWMKWLVYMPSAAVKGTITIDNQTRRISAVGYHDHNWGRWAFNDARRNWAQVSAPEDGFTLTLGDVFGEQKNTILGIQHAGEIIKFSNAQIKLSYANFSLDQVTLRMYPTAYKVEADNGEYKLDLMINVLKNMPLPVNYPAPIPSYIIFEQVSKFSGSLKPKKGTTYSFDRMGFSEYTTNKLHPIIGKVNATDPANITITATNERTGVVKTADPSPSGWFSIDCDFVDYLANSTAPWIANGDSVKVVAKDTVGNTNSSVVIANLTMDRQDIGTIELG
ncbi:MAG: hypothetical protein ACE14P_03035 [Methanotrichaceae archaeon]